MTVTRYRRYSLDEHGRIGLSEEIDAESDREAIALLRELKPDCIRSELWKHRTLVATIHGCELVIEHT